MKRRTKWQLSMEVYGFVARFPTLTVREATVLAEACKGRRQATICERLRVSRNTMKRHVAKILLKTGRESIAHLVEEFGYGFWGRS